jgi:hypothetical protein
MNISGLGTHKHNYCSIIKLGVPAHHTGPPLGRVERGGGLRLKLPHPPTTLAILANAVISSKCILKKSPILVQCHSLHIFLKRTELSLYLGKKVPTVPLQQMPHLI